MILSDSERNLLEALADRLESEGDRACELVRKIAREGKGRKLPTDENLKTMMIPGGWGLFQRVDFGNGIFDWQFVGKCDPPTTTELDK